MEVGDDGAVGTSWLGYYKHQTASPRPTVNATRAMRASLATTHDARIVCKKDHALNTLSNQHHTL